MTTETQLTAVEWLEKICNERGYNLMSEYFNQAKEMEKQQIENAYDKVSMIKFAQDWEKSNLDCKEDLYKETYGE